MVLITQSGEDWRRKSSVFFHLSEEFIPELPRLSFPIPSLPSYLKFRRIYHALEVHRSWSLPLSPILPTIKFEKLEFVFSVLQRLSPIAQIATQQISSHEVFEGLNGSDLPVAVCETRSLPPALSLEEAMVTLHAAIKKLKADSPPSESGALRFQVCLTLFSSFLVQC